MRLTSRQPQSCTTELHRCGHRSRCTDFVAPQSCTDAVTDFVAPQSCTDAATDLVAQISLHHRVAQMQLTSHRTYCARHVPLLEQVCAHLRSVRKNVSHHQQYTPEVHIPVLHQEYTPGEHIPPGVHVPLLEQVCAHLRSARKNVSHHQQYIPEIHIIPPGVHIPLLEQVCAHLRSARKNVSHHQQYTPRLHIPHTSTSPGVYTRRSYTTRSTHTTAGASVRSPTLCKEECFTPPGVHRCRVSPHVPWRSGLVEVCLRWSE